MKKLKLGVIGIGNIAVGLHLPALVQNENVELVAFCDINEKKAVKEAEKYGVKHVFRDYCDLLAMSEIDAVDICTPNYMHSVIAVDALKKGKHVFCEKPDAINVIEVKKMKDAADEAGKLLMVMRNNRFINTSQYLKAYIEQGEMGEIYAGRCGWIRRRGIPGKGGWFTTKEQSGGGPLIDLGVHMIDLSIWLMGNPRPVAVTGAAYSKFASNNAGADSIHSAFGEAKEEGICDVEDLAMGFIKFDNGACLSIEFSWASNIAGEDAFVELMGTKCGSSWHMEEGTLKLYGEINGATVDLNPNIKNDEGGHGRNLNHFVECLMNGAEPIFVPQQGVNMIKILQAIYESAATGKEIAL